MMTPEELNEAASRARQGDASALEELVQGLQHTLYRLALRFLGHPELARDATQEILILVVTRLSTFRGESAVTTWAFRIATRHLMRQRRRDKRWTLESMAENDLGQAPNDVAPSTLATAEQTVLEEEIFVGCTQAMLQALDKPLRLAFVLGVICELESVEAASIMGISPVAFRKRLSRARTTLDSFLARNCGVANPANRCRCVYQINYNVERGMLDPTNLRFAVPAARSSVEAVRALGDIRKLRRSLELFRAQPVFNAPHDFAEHMRRIIASTASLGAS